MNIYVREYSWMWNDLHLSLAECRVYAYIYGLTHGDKGGFDGSKRGLAKSLGLSEASVRNILDTLTEKSLISYTNGLWLSESRTDKDSAESVRSSAQPMRESAQPMRESAQPVRENAQPLRSPHTSLLYNNKNKESVPRTSADTTTEINILNKIYYQIDMESLDDALKRRESIKVIWELLNPAPEFRDFYGDVMRYWNRIPRDRQLQMWYFLKRKIDNKQPLDPNPLQVIKDCHPYPIDYNGTAAYKDMIASPVKMVKACYRGHFGAYELMDARLWHMTHIEALN